jgi:8-oxo-dGTP pyrophosphatase MutT (NUDIX family)
MGLQRRVRAAQNFDQRRFSPFLVAGVVVGWVRRDLVSHLDAYPAVFGIGEGGIALRDDVRGYAARTEAMARVAGSLAARGLLTKWRGETYEIGLAEGGKSIFRLERAAVRFFGFNAQAVHLNGLVRRGRETSMWIARRSHDKAIDPGMLDNLVGGGVASGLSVQQTLVKEAWEEAAIPSSLAGSALPVGTLRVCREVADGLHAEVIHVYDLALPHDFLPVNQDGEVAEFRRLSLAEVARELEGDAPYTIDAGLVAIDCIRRHAPSVNNRG